MKTTNIRFPVLGLSKGDSLYLWDHFDEERSCTLLALVHGYFDRLTLYDSAGLSWPVAQATPTRPISKLARWLAPICYNPRITVRLSFKDPFSYDLDEVKAEICALVDKDDDCMTQNIEPGELKALISEAQSFGALVKKLKKYRVI